MRESATAVYVRMPAAGAVARSPAHVGVLYGIGAYGLWGLFPLYFKALKHVPALEVLCHRVIWSLLLLAGLLLVRGFGRQCLNVLRVRRTVALLAVTTVLIAGNWLVFVWAVANDHVLQASLGYFINPLVNVLLGFIFLRERLRRWQVVSVGLAATGVGVLTLTAGQLPVLALFLAGTFALYGLLRKTATVDALNGLALETAFLAPLALGYLVWQMAAGRAAFASGSTRLDLLLMAAGVVTAVPLLWFTEAARRLRLATLGFLQYLSPTGHFLLAVLAFGEPFSHVELVAFVCIWTGLAIFSVEAGLRGRKLGKTEPRRTDPALEHDLL